MKRFVLHALCFAVASLALAAAVFEGVFQVGDVVHCVCEHLETTDSVAPKRDRFILQDVIHFGAT